MENISGKKFHKLKAIKPLYIRNRTCVWLCRCDCGNKTQTKIASLKNGTTKSCGCYRNVTKKVQMKIISDYNKNICNKALAKKYKRHRVTIQRVLKINNIRLRKQDETARKKIPINFKNGIINNNDAYILGLIYADGNLYRYAVEICLRRKDKELLLNISNYIYGKDTLSYRKGRKKNGIIYKSSGQYRFSISSKDIINRLKKLGLHENKSLTIRFPQINNKYISHFIRGVFDGDGCIFVSKKYKGTNRATIVSNYLFCNDLKLNIEMFLDINVCIQYKTKNVGTVSISGNNQIKKFMNWIYKDSDIKMKRKYDKYMEEYYPD